MEQSGSRPPAPVVAPIEHEGIRYEQGDGNGGYLVARDAETGERLWRLRVYEVSDHGAAGISGTGRYFRSMTLVAEETAIEIENETGAWYRVDLSTRIPVQLSGPAPRGEAASAPLTPKPNPQ